jgi:hypothetical protein
MRCWILWLLVNSPSRLVIYILSQDCDYCRATHWCADLRFPIFTFSLRSGDNPGKFGDGVAAPENKGEDMVIGCLHGMLLV